MDIAFTPEFIRWAKTIGLVAGGLIVGIVIGSFIFYLSIIDAFRRR